MSDGYARPAKNGTPLYLRVAPGAQRTSLAGTCGEHALQLSVSAPPVDGNAEVERFLADLLSLPRSSVPIERSAASKTALLRDTHPRRVRQTISTRLP